MYGRNEQVPCNTLGVPRETLTERLMKERENLQDRLDEIDTVLKALKENPQIQGILDVLQKCRAW